MRRPRFLNQKVAALLSIAILAIAVASFTAFAQTAKQDQAAVLNAAKKEALLHWMYIGMEDIQSLMQQYSDNAVLYWLGGPLNGEYEGKAAIQAVWTKFFTANGDEYVRVKNVNTYIVGEEVYVVADVAFHLKKTATGQWIKLSLTYILVFDKKTLKITEEWWIIRAAGGVP